MTSSIAALFRTLTQGVYVIGVAHGDKRNAFTAAWVMQVSFDPLLLALSINAHHSSYALLRMEINVRASTIIGAVGGGGIGQELKLSISRGFGAKTIAMMLLLFITIFAVDQFSAWLRRRMVGDQAFNAIS